MKWIAQRFARRWRVASSGALLLICVAVLTIPPLRERAERLYNQVFRADELAASDAYERTRGRDDLSTLGGWVGGLPDLPPGYTIWGVSHDAVSGAVYLNIDTPDWLTLILARFSLAAADEVHNVIPESVLQHVIEIAVSEDQTLEATFIRGDWSGSGWDQDAPMSWLRWRDERAAYEIMIYAAVAPEDLTPLAAAVSGP